MSRRLVIAIDCDDVLISTTEYLISTYNATYGANVKLANAYKSENSEWACDNRETIFQRHYDIQRSEGYALLRPSDVTIRAINNLANNHELHIVTARSGEVAHVTERMVARYFHNCFKSIEHVGVDNPKGAVCRRIGADILIDDNYHNLQSAIDHNVPYSIWFGKYQWQDSRPSNFNEGIIRCYDWDSVERAVVDYGG